MEIRVRPENVGRYFLMETFLKLNKGIAENLEKEIKEMSDKFKCGLFNIIFEDIPVINHKNLRVFIRIEWRKVDIANKNELIESGINVNDLIAVPGVDMSKISAIIGTAMSVKECILFDEVIPDVVLDRLNEVKKIKEQQQKA